MKKITLFAFLLALIVPFSVSAHAAPVEYSPQSSAQLADAPAEIRIRFSERVESGASRITVQSDSGETIHTGPAVVDDADAHFLSVPVKDVDKGTFLVTWSVVSSDDGHFTKGGYAYFVGVTGSSTAVSSPQIEIVQLSATPEATAMFVELLGNSFLWGVLVMFAFVLRRSLVSASDVQRRVIQRGYVVIVLVGVLLVLGGAIAHTALKTTELAALHGISIREALPLYLATVSGSATVVRAAVIALFGVIFLVFRKSILKSNSFTKSEIALFILLCVFAYFRAKVSHATANPFFPDISVGVNFLHLIGKGLWEGLLGALCLVYLSRSLRPLVSSILPKTFALLSVSFGIVGASAAYIIWLHLKDFANVTSTLWGQRFIPLAAVAVLAVVLLGYHILANRYARNLLRRTIAYTLPAEFAIGILVVFFSSLMIITSPPIEQAQTKVFKEESNGLTITLQKAPYEDGMALLSISGNSALKDPVVIIGGEGGLIVDVQRRFTGGFVFPSTILSPAEPQALHITAGQEGGYDAQATFSVVRSDIDPPEQKGHGRTLDFFTFIFVLVGLGAIATAYVLYKLSHGEYVEVDRRFSAFQFVIGLFAGLLVASQLVGIGYFFLSNNYKKECIADGNGWHIMLPTKNGIPVSAVPREGCMALNGSYHLPDAREYRFFKTPGDSRVAFASDMESLRAGVPTNLEFSILDQDGKPALLSVQHERLVHFIVISSDMREFKHIHPDDARALTSTEINDSTFTVPVTFPSAGEYILGLDYAHGLTPVSKSVRVTVKGSPQQPEQIATYPDNGTFEGYDVSLDYSSPVAGEFATLIYKIQKDGKDVRDLTPYLAAAMHVAVVKNDLSEFLHTHGEVHIPGAPVKPLNKQNAHQHTPPPAQFGPLIESHPIFPTPGLYTVFGQFKHDGKVVTSRFTIRVEE